MKARKWMMEYGVAMILAVVCAVILGHLSLFREATIGKLHASDRSVHRIWRGDGLGLVRRTSVVR